MVGSSSLRCSERSNRAKPDDKAKSIARNTSVLTIAQFSGIIVMVLLTPFILHHLGIHLFGLWAFVSAIVAFASLLNLGLGRGTARFVAVYAERGEVDVIRRIVTYGILSHVVVGLLLTPLAWLAGQILLPHTAISEADLELAQNVLLLTFLVVVFAAGVRPLGSLLIGLERIWITSLAVLASQVAYAAAVVALFSAGRGSMAW